MKNASVKIQDAEIAKNNKGCFPYGNKIHIIKKYKKNIKKKKARFETLKIQIL